MLVEVPCRKCEKIVFDAQLPNDLDGDYREATLMVAKALHPEHTLFRADVQEDPNRGIGLLEDYFTDRGATDRKILD